MERQYADESLRLKQSQRDGHARELTALHAKIAAHDERLVRNQDAGKVNQAEYAHSLAVRDSELRSLGEKLARSEVRIQEKEQEVARYKAAVGSRLDAENVRDFLSGLQFPLFFFPLLSLAH